VSVIINGIRPYQRAIRVGTNGTEDYTSCQFTGDPGYTTVKLGQNKITVSILVSLIRILTIHNLTL